MTPIIIPMLMPRVSGSPDGRERCPHCHRVMPKDCTFLKWLGNSFWGIGLTVWSIMTGLFFLMGTVIYWAPDGNAWSDPILGDAHRTLVQCIWLNLQWLWHLAGRIA